MRKNLAPISIQDHAYSFNVYRHAFVSRLYLAYAKKDFKIVWHKFLEYLDFMPLEILNLVTIC